MSLPETKDTSAPQSPEDKLQNALDVTRDAADNLRALGPLFEASRRYDGTDFHEKIWGICWLFEELSEQLEAAALGIDEALIQL